MAVPSRATIEWAARETIRMHTEDLVSDRAVGRCAQCPPAGDCPQYQWALSVTASDRIDAYDGTGRRG